MMRRIAELSGVEPLDALSAWHEERPLAALISARSASRWSRWSILAEPTETLVIEDPVEALEALDKVAGSAPSHSCDNVLPFVGGWIACFAYDLGHAIEPTARATGRIHRFSGEPDWPALVLQRCPNALIYDGERRQWWSVGEIDLSLQDGDSQARSFTLEDDGARANRSEYVDAVARAIELIHAGDIFQANIAHRMSGHFEGSVRAMARSLMDQSQAWFGAHLEIFDADAGLDSVVTSASPELFFSYNARSRCVTTRPIKGTRPAASDPKTLDEAEKDRAELNMIIDLMRNDLGRVCEYSSVRVTNPREIETHAQGVCGGGVHHGVATIEGCLRDERSLADLLRATFPAGSITGAPKVRAMQIIDELEPVPRGPHFGAIGYISDCGNAQFNVAIRTAALRCESGSTIDHATGRLDYMAGAGIVADSDPDSEWDETLVKAQVFTSLQPTCASAALR